MNHIGIDVDSKNLVCCIQHADGKRGSHTFPNQPAGHRRFIAWALKSSNDARICMEATGVYSLPLALTLAKTRHIEVMVVNPKAMKHFATAILQRGKTDQMDAQCILEYLLRMNFRAWSAPTEKALEMQQLSRRVRQLTGVLVQERNRLQAAEKLGKSGRLCRADIKAHIKQLEKRIERCQHSLVVLIVEDEDLKPQFDRLTSIVGVADKSASRLLAELSMLPGGLSARQWVAHAGLDPKPHESGTSILKPRRITRAGNSHIRDALYFPALVATRHDPNVKAFYEKLIQRGKKKKQAITAIMRKLLVAIWGMLKNDEDWNGEKFYRIA